jgi:hypothetical protein
MKISGFLGGKGAVKPLTYPVRQFLARFFKEKNKVPAKKTRYANAILIKRPVGKQTTVVRYCKPAQRQKRFFQNI